MKGNGPFRWDTLVPYIIHPLKVAIIEALRWIDEPLSATDLTKIFGGATHRLSPANDKVPNAGYGLSHISYHIAKLAETGAIEVVSSRPVRGSLEKFYFFP